MGREAIFTHRLEHQSVSDSKLLESLECAIILVDREGIVERVNIAAEALFAQSRRYLIGTRFAELIPDQAVADCMAECLSQGSQFTLREVSIDVAHREVLVDTTLSCATAIDESAPSVLVELNVINRISRFMKEKNQLERQQAFRLMMRGLAHEIKNPLGGIRGAAQLLDRELHQGSQKELTGILIKEADRLTRLVDRVMGSREQLKLKFLNIHEVLEHVVHLVSVRAPEPPHIERFYDPTLPEIKADKEQLIQAVLNIVTNAIEAQAGQEHCRLGFVTQFDRFFTINQEMHRQVLRLRIWDEGPGVPEALQETLFDPLITGRPEGPGLGLSITQEIIQRHSGAVQLDKYRGKTCFSIVLPYLSDEAAEKDQGESS